MLDLNPSRFRARSCWLSDSTERLGVCKGRTEGMEGIFRLGQRARTQGREGSRGAERNTVRMGDSDSVEVRETEIALCLHDGRDRE
jgi:hypothetical protein